uniref:Homeodomain 1 n=1 Tax=Mycena chlorophos TaxID=658473 RepID=A0ABQ0LB95_MYCCL|nr:homeodomain 1 [Mycena chlorophos]
MSIHERLQRVEDDFLALSFSNDFSSPTALAFLETWLQLQADAEAAMDSNTLDASTVSLAHTVASKISIFTGSLLAAHAEGDAQLETLEQAPVKERTTVKAKRRVVSPSVASGSSPVSRIRRKDTSLPTYIEPAYKWLLRHLYDPYPSKTVKQDIATESECSVERVDEWFKKVRHRIGWTRVWKQEFGRQRNAMCEAAARYFHPASTEPVSPRLRSYFAEIEFNAREAYASKLIPTTLSNKMAAAVKDMTPELREQAMLERELAAVAYPTPADSPISDEGASTSSPIRSRKRRLSEADAYPSLPKRPRNRHVSDPTPSSSSVQPEPEVITLSGDPEFYTNWFSNNEPQLDLFDPTVPLDIRKVDPMEFNAFPESPDPLTPVNMPQLTSDDPITLNLDMSELFAPECASLFPHDPFLPSSMNMNPFIYQHDDFSGPGCDANYLDSYISFPFPPLTSINPLDPCIY